MFQWVINVVQQTKLLKEKTMTLEDLQRDLKTQKEESDKIKSDLEATK